MEKKEYIDGTRGGSGKYTFRGASVGNYSVTVSHMPEDTFSYRVMFSHRDIVNQHISISREHAHALWAAIKRTAEDMGWSDEFEPKGPIK